MNILHVIPKKTTAAKNYFLGVTKDIAGRTEYFLARGLPVTRLIIDEASDDAALPLIRKQNMDSYQAVVFEYPLFPRTIRYLKNRYPALIVIVRGSNAAFIQWLHFAKAKLLVTGDITGAIRDAFYSIVRFWCDYQCARYADYVLSISAWETSHYWKRITHKRILTVPYYLPTVYQASARNHPKKKNQCICQLSTKVSMLPFLLDAVRTFSTLVDQFDGKKGLWKWTVTGEFPSNASGLSKKIHFLGFVDNPLTILQESRILVLLSDYGFGFKTKVLDAISCSCYVLVTEKLFRRLPEEVAPFCIIVDPQSVDSFAASLKKSLRPFPKGDPNKRLQKKAWQALDTIFYATN